MNDNARDDDGADERERSLGERAPGAEFVWEERKRRGVRRRERETRRGKQSTWFNSSLFTWTRSVNSSTWHNI